MYWNAGRPGGEREVLRGGDRRAVAEAIVSGDRRQSWRWLDRRSGRRLARRPLDRLHAREPRLLGLSLRGGAQCDTGVRQLLQGTADAGPMRIQVDIDAAGSIERSSSRAWQKKRLSHWRGKLKTGSGNCSDQYCEQTGDYRFEVK